MTTHEAMSGQRLDIRPSRLNKVTEGKLYRPSRLRVGGIKSSPPRLIETAKNKTNKAERLTLLKYVLIMALPN